MPIPKDMDPDADGLLAILRRGFTVCVRSVRVLSNNEGVRCLRFQWMFIAQSGWGCTSCSSTCCDAGRERPSPGLIGRRVCDHDWKVVCDPAHPDAGALQRRKRRPRV
jgi:hypothetical protein